MKRVIAISAALTALVAGCSTQGSDTDRAKPSNPCAVLTAAEVTSVFEIAVNDGVHDPAEDVYGKTCAWAPPGKDAWLDKVLMVTPLNAHDWKEQLDAADGAYDEHTDNTLTKRSDSRVRNADEAYLVTSTGIDGPGSSQDTVQYVSLLVRKGPVRLEVHAFAGSRLPAFQDAAIEAPLDEQIAELIFRKSF